MKKMLKYVLLVLFISNCFTNYAQVEDYQYKRQLTGIS